MTEEFISKTNVLLIQSRNLNHIKDDYHEHLAS